MTVKNRKSKRRRKIRRRRRIAWKRILPLLIGLFILITVISKVINKLTADPIQTQIEEIEIVENPLLENDYDWQYLDNTQQLYTYADQKYASIVGIDVSYSQGQINWQSVKNDGIQFAVIRLGYRGYTNGELHEDEWFRTNMDCAANAGILTQVYFFSQAVTEEEAIEEAEFCMERIKNDNVSIIAYDMEPANNGDDRIKDLTQSERTACALAFCNRVKEAGYVPMIYGSKYWFDSAIAMSKIQSAAALWMAHYGIDYPEYPYKFNMWQYTDEGQVNGISGNVDLNILFVGA